MRLRPVFDSEKICGHDQFPVTSKKLFPGCPAFALWSWLNPVALQNIRNRAPRDLVPQVRQRALNPTIAPIPILFSHSDHQRLDLIGPTRSSRPTLCTAVVLLGDQLAMPREQGFWRHDGGYLRQQLSS